MVLTLTRPCRYCGGAGEYRQPDPAGRGDFVRCELCNPEPPPTEMAKLLDRIEWSAPQAARRLGYGRSTIERWRVGTNTRGKPWDAPPEVLDKLRRVAEAIDRELGR